MALTLSGPASAQQALSHLVARPGKSVIFFWTALDGTGFDAVAAQRVDLQVAQRHTRTGVGQSAECIGEADAVDGNLLAHRGCMRDGADQVINQ